MRVRPYLRLTRAHTAPLETVPALFGALLATGGQINMSVGLWGLYGLLYHLTGYGMNSTLDWEKGYDRNDRNKQHHPLNRGSISLTEAKLLTVGLFLFLVTLGVGLAWGEYLALASMVLGAIAGVSYNTIGKETEYKFILISIAHTTVFVVPYLAMGGDVFAIEFRLATAYIFLWVVFQISVSGEIKDILEMSEANFLRDRLGVLIHKEQYPDLRSYLDNDILDFSKEAQMYAIGVKGLSYLIAPTIFFSLSGLPMFRYTPESILFLAVWFLIMVPTVAFTILLTGDGRYYRSWRISMMARIELLTMFMFIIALYPVIGLGAAVTLIAGSAIWVLSLNQLEWGRWLAPDV